MRHSLTIICPDCHRPHHYNSELLSKVLWNECNNHRQRSYGEEILYRGELKIDCGIKPRMLQCQVYEYPRGSVRVQHIIDEGKLVSEEVSISAGLSLTKTKSDSHPYGTKFPNRTGGDYVILDSLISGYAVKLDNDMIWLLGILIPPSFHRFYNFEMEDSQNKQQRFLPATVCCCMNIESRRYSFGISCKLMNRVVGVLRCELDKLGFNPTKETNSSKNACPYYIGHCSEVNAANKVLLKKATDLKNLFFSVAIRPRTMQIIEPCMNCATIFPTL